MYGLHPAICALLGVVLAAPALQAASLTVAPTRVVLEGQRLSASLTVRNESEEPALIQIETLRWTQAVPTIRTEPSRDLLAVPPVFRLPPGGEQTVRVGLRIPPTDGPERTYRLLLSEVTTDEDRGQGGVRFALRLSIPVFVRARGVEEQLIARLQSGTQGWMVAVHNAGTAHARLIAVKVRERGGASLTVEGEPGYLLPGETRLFSLRGRVLRSGETIEVELESQSGSHAFALVVGDG